MTRFHSLSLSTAFSIIFLISCQQDEYPLTRKEMTMKQVSEFLKIIGPIQQNISTITVSTVSLDRQQYIVNGINRILRKNGYTTLSIVPFENISLPSGKISKTCYADFTFYYNEQFGEDWFGLQTCTWCDNVNLSDFHCMYTYNN